MQFKNISDCHNHSNNSYDAQSTVEQMYKRAKEIGFLYYAITDHCECDEFYNDYQGYQSVVENSYNQMLKIKEFDKNFLIGVELGQAMSDPKACEEALSGRDFDVVIGSLHRVKGYDDFFYWKEKKTDPDELLGKYFDEILDMIDTEKFDTLAHLSYPLRYMYKEDGSRLSFDPYKEQIEVVFKKLIEKGIALEMNTSGLRQTIKEVLPNAQILKMYKDLGGEMITIGSDAHCTADLGKGLNEGLETLLNIGYKHFTVFKERKPIMINIE